MCQTAAWEYRFDLWYVEWQTATSDPLTVLGGDVRVAFGIDEIW